MTDKARQRLEVGIIALLFGAGAGWGAFQFQLGDLNRRLTRIEDRVTAIYCASVAESQRAACR
jgi:hypothetical protein